MPPVAAAITMSGRADRFYRNAFDPLKKMRTPCSTLCWPAAEGYPEAHHERRLAAAYTTAADKAGYSRHYRSTPSVRS